MLKYCPDEMTPDRIANLDKHQKPVSPNMKLTQPAAISEREAFENWFNTECSLPDINTIYGTVAWAAWKARAKAANIIPLTWELRRAARPLDIKPNHAEPPRLE